MLQILIVEDDPMVSSINAQYLEKAISQQPLAVSHTNNATDALRLCQKNNFDLLLVDIYLPKISGTDLLKLLTQNHLHPNVIMLTAANDVNHVTQALNYGIVDYLIKPFSFSRFNAAIDRFLLLNHTLIKQQTFSQANLDQFFISQNNLTHNGAELPKGLSSYSLNKVKQAIKQAPNPFSNQDIAKLSKLSRISTKKYLDFLEKHEQIYSTIHYLKIGRPVKVYHLTANTKK